MGSLCLHVGEDSGSGKTWGEKRVDRTGVDIMDEGERVFESSADRICSQGRWV